MGSVTSTSMYLDTAESELLSDDAEFFMWQSSLEVSSFIVYKASRLECSDFQLVFLNFHPFPSLEFIAH